MSDALLPYYAGEIDALRREEGEILRRQAAKFARDYPKIAERLRVSGTDGTTDDPHVSRLLEGLAFLGARVRHRLDDEFPELTDALLSVLYPHYLAPFPACVIGRFTCLPDRDTAVTVARNATVESPPVQGQVCTFLTASPLTVWPIVVEQAKLHGRPFPGPENPYAGKAQSMLHLTLRCASPDGAFSALRGADRQPMDRIRLFLGPASPASLQLYELLCGHAISISFARDMGDSDRVIPAEAAIRAIGFEHEDRLLPWSARGFAGFRLLSEYFAFPEKFLFVELIGIPAAAFGNRMEVLIYLDQAAPELVRTVNKDMLVPGCVPMVNLFEKRCESVPVDHTAIELPVIPDRGRPEALEVWSVEAVRESWNGGARPWRPFYRRARTDGDAAMDLPSYVTVRRASPETRPGQTPVGGTAMFLAPCDKGGDLPPERSDLSIDALCTNRDLPHRLPFGGDGMAMQSTADVAGIATITAVTPVSPTLRPRLRERRFWRLVSHLSLGHLSLEGERGAEALQEVLRLYNLGERDDADAGIKALRKITAKPGVARVPGLRPGAFCRGLDVSMVFDQRAWQAHGLYLLASVLDRFLGLHGQVNSFVRCSVRWREDQPTIAAWPARAGGRTLI